MIAAEISSAMLVLDARIAVAEECVRSMHDAARARQLARALDNLQTVREDLEALQARPLPISTDAAWTYLAAVRDWASDVATAIRYLSQDDDQRARRAVAERSCTTILDVVVPSFARVERVMRSDVWSDLLRLQANVVDLNWTLAL